MGVGRKDRPVGNAGRRRNSVSAIERRERTRSRLLFIGGAILLVIFVVAACGGGTSPEQIATDFIEARDTWDAEATEGLLAPDAAIDDLEVPRRADYEAVPVVPGCRLALGCRRVCRG